MAKVLIFAYFVKNLIEMRRAGDIVAISIPFTSGVVAAALLPHGGGETYFRMAAFSSTILTLLLIYSGRRTDRKHIILLVFFLIGMSCFMAADAGGEGQPELLWAKRALDKFCKLLDSVGFDSVTTGPLVKALLTGRRTEMDGDIVASFRASGASHILALSGLHLGVIYSIVRKTLGILGNSRPASILRSITTISTSGFYMMMTGASPSIVRAFLFITIGELSRLFPGRLHSNMSTYCSALTIQLCINPLAINSIGFQLSYLAMLGIFVLFPVMESWYPMTNRFDPVRKIWKSMALSLSCQIFTAPLVWYSFHTFPKYFLLTNLLALPLTEALIISAVAATTFSAAGCCPEIVKGLTDFLGQALVSCLKTISSL